MLCNQTVDLVQINTHPLIQSAHLLRHTNSRKAILVVLGRSMIGPAERVILVHQFVQFVTGAFVGFEEFAFEAYLTCQLLAIETAVQNRMKVALHLNGSRRRIEAQQQISLSKLSFVFRVPVA